MKNKKKLIEFWKKSSLIDYRAACKLIEVKKYPHALFFGHLAVEKMLKAIFIDTNDEHPPITHNLIFLVNKCKKDIPKEFNDEMIEINSFNIESRYPDIKFQFYKKCSAPFAKKHMEKIGAIIKWLTKIS